MNMHRFHMTFKNKLCTYEKRKKTLTLPLEFIVEMAFAVSNRI
jgi:hypothetical protein